MYAIIKSGGKQYKVEPGMVVKVEKLEAEVGSEVSFEALLTSDGKAVSVGDPVLGDVAVKGTVLAHEKAKKVIVFKYKPKKDYRKKQGHRQPYTKVVITQVGSEIVKAEKPAAAKKADAAAAAAEKKPAAAAKAADSKAAAEKKPAVKATAAKTAEKKPAAKATAEKKPAAKKTATAEKKPAAKATAEKKPAAKATAEKKPAEKKAAATAEKPAAKKPAAKKETESADTKAE